MIESIREALEYLDTVVDESDPDTESSQMQHALQVRKWRMSFNLKFRAPKVGSKSYINNAP